MLLLLLACATEAPPFPGATPRDVPQPAGCAQAWRYRDGDGDGWGDDATARRQCAEERGWVAEPGDCDDQDESVHPGGTEHCDGRDHDCDGEVYEEGSREVRNWYTDADGDGEGRRYAETACLAPAGTVENAADCDDSRADVNTRAAEVCDAEGVDEDCDGRANDADTSVSGGVAWWVDTDRDGYGDADGAVNWSCEPPAASAPNDDDCDDTDAAWPGVVYQDIDRDGWGFVELWGCPAAPSVVGRGGDCADMDPTVNPGVHETDCTSFEDLNCDGVVGFEDPDGDGVPNCEDCDEADPEVHEGAPESCNGLDDDCDGDVDEDAADGALWYQDADGDGYGADAVVVQSCTEPAGWVERGGDCDDTSRRRSPDDAETCGDLVDENCDGRIDEDGAVGCTETWVDEDGDGYGDGATGICSCSERGEGWSTVDGDCDDGDATVHPGWDDPAGGGDQNCDGSEVTVSTVGPPDYLGRTVATYLGQSLVCPGDLDGDGVPELVLRSGRGSGGTVVAWSADRTGVVEPADGLFWVAAAPEGSVSVGMELATGADLDGDGLAELILADPDRADGGRGRYASVYVVPGASRGAVELERSRHVWAADTGSHLGAALGLGAEGGTTLLVIGDPDDGDGAVWIYDTLPRASGVVGRTAVQIGPGVGSGSVGGWLGDPRDLDGDGVLDLVVGDDDASSYGEVSVYLGPFDGDRTTEDADGSLSPDTRPDHYPVVLETAPDWDGDGRAELLLGSSDGLYVWGEVSGARWLEDAALTVEVAAGPEPAAALLGPDLDEDGSADLIAGFSRVDGPDSETGLLLAFHGPATGTLTLEDTFVALYGEGSNLQLPDSLAAVPGTGELFVGASRDGTGGSFAGAVWLLSPERWR